MFRWSGHESFDESFSNFSSTAVCLSAIDVDLWFRVLFTLCLCCSPATFLALWLSWKLQQQARKWNAPLPCMKLQTSQGLNIVWNVGTQLNQRTTILWDTHRCMNIYPPVYTHTLCCNICCWFTVTHCIMHTSGRVCGVRDLVLQLVNGHPELYSSLRHTHTLTHTHMFTQNRCVGVCGFSV